MTETINARVEYANAISGYLRARQLRAEREINGEPRSDSDLTKFYFHLMRFWEIVVNR